MRKLNRALYGPALSEVVLGASLSVALGAVLGIAYLVFTPVLTVKEIPKEAPPDAVYYIPGPRGGSNPGLLNTKRKIFAAGTSITVSEEELNSLAAIERPAVPPKPKAAAGAKAEAPAGPVINLCTPGTPNIRIREGEMQVVVPVKVSLFGYNQEVLVQTRGPFVKREAGFVYDPEKLWIGSCPAGRLPGVTALVIHKVLLPKPLPEDIATAWGKLADVAVVGTTLKLTMP